MCGIPQTFFIIFIKYHEQNIARNIRYRPQKIKRVEIDILFEKTAYQNIVLSVYFYILVAASLNHG